MTELDALAAQLLAEDHETAELYDEQEAENAARIEAERQIAASVASREE